MEVHCWMWERKGRIVAILEVYLPFFLFFVLIFMLSPLVASALLAVGIISMLVPYLATFRIPGKKISTRVRIAHLVHPHEWDGGSWSLIHCYDYPDMWSALEKSRFNPGIKVEVETPHIDEEDDLLKYDLVFITGHSLREPWRLTEKQKSKLDFYLRNGGTIWIDQCGNDGGPRAPNLVLQNFPLRFEWREKFPWSHFHLRQRIAEDHPLLNGEICYEIRHPSFLGLPRLPWTAEIFLENLDPRFRVLVEDSKHHPTIVVAEKIGEKNGKLILTSYDFACSIHVWKDFIGFKYDPQDLMFAYNLLLWSKRR